MSIIQSCSVVEKFFRKNRWYAKLDPPFGGRATMPYANYLKIALNRARNVPGAD